MHLLGYDIGYPMVFWLQHMSYTEMDRGYVGM